MSRRWRVVRGAASPEVRYVVLFGKTYAAVTLDGKVTMVPVTDSESRAQNQNGGAQ